MSAARKIAPSAPTSAELESHCLACEKTLGDAETTLAAAEAAAAAPHEDDHQRSLELGAAHNAKLRVQHARDKLTEHRTALDAAKRSEDEAEAKGLADRVSRAAQMREVVSINKAFETLVFGGLKRFFTDMIERRARFHADAQQLDRVLRRLGHGYRLSGVDLEHGTGTEQIPASVSVDTLKTYIGPLRELLQERMRSTDHLDRAAAILLLGAFELDRDRHLAAREVEMAVHHHHAELGKKGVAP